MGFCDLIFEEFEKCSTMLDKRSEEIAYANDVLELIDDIEKVVATNNIVQIDKMIDCISKYKVSNNLSDFFKMFLHLSKILLKVNTSFEQYDECAQKLYTIKKQYQEVIGSNKLECEQLSGKIKVFEYVDKIGLPIDSEEKIKEIVNKCKLEGVSPVLILKIIMEANIHVYNSQKVQTKKDEYLTVEKMTKLGVDDETQELILEIKDLIKNIKSDSGDGMVNYLLTINDEDELDEALDNYLFVCDDVFVLGVFKNLLDRVNNGDDVFELLSSIYFKYLERSKNNELNDLSKTKLIFLVKPTSNTPYIYDDIEKIESKVLRQRLKRQFLELANGNMSGKSLTMQGMFEKKRFKVRITFTMLPDNYVLIVNCYQKGINGIAKLKERLNPSATAQIMLYKALISNDEQEIDKAISYITKSLKISSEEIDNYISNFRTFQDINIFDYLEKGGETKCF